MNFALNLFILWLSIKMIEQKNDIFQSINIKFFINSDYDAEYE